MLLSIESGDFDWDYDDQVQAIDNFNKEPEQQASQDTVNLPEDRWRNAGLLDEPNNK